MAWRRQTCRDGRPSKCNARCKLPIFYAAPHPISNKLIPGVLLSLIHHSSDGHKVPFKPYTLSQHDEDRWHQWRNMIHPAGYKCMIGQTPALNDFHQFNDVRAWALAIIAIRGEYLGEYLLRRDGDPLDILCENKLGDYAILHFGMENVYLLGFTENHKAYEYGKQGKIIHEIPRSTFLGYDSGYLDFGVSHSLTVVKIGYQTLKHALMEIIKGGRLVDHALIASWMNHIAPLMPTIVMVPESVRFKWHFVTIRRMMNQGEQYAGDEFVTDWIGSGIKKLGVCIGRQLDLRKTLGKNSLVLEKAGVCLVKDMQFCVDQRKLCHEEEEEEEGGGNYVLIRK
ncbi:chain A, active ribosome inactivating protein [Tanacetum coccineum]